MGSIYGGLLAQSGNKVTLIDTWTAHIDEINKRGLKIDGPNGLQTIKNVFASNNINNAASSDLIIIATKVSKVEEVAEQISTFISKNSIVLTIQNGLGSAEKVAKFIGREQILLGVADGFGASVMKPGQIHHNAMKLIRIGSLKKSGTKKALKICRLWENAGFKVKTFSDIERLVWEKFICNVTFSAPCTVFNCRIGELMDCRELWEIALGCMREAYDIGQKRKISFSFDNPETYVSEFGEKMPMAKPSMLLDHDKGQRSEIDFINGMVVTLGIDMGIKTPYNQTLCAIISSREASFKS